MAIGIERPNYRTTPEDEFEHTPWRRLRRFKKGGVRKARRECRQTCLATRRASASAAFAS